MVKPPRRDKTIIPARVADGKPAAGSAGEVRLADGLLEAGWLLAALLVPLYFNLGASQPFEPPKAALLRSLAWLLAGLWLADCLLAGRSPWRELRANPLLWPALAVAAVVLASTFLAVDRGLALWGSFGRAQGALTLLSYPALFLVVAARLATPARARRLAATLVVTAVPLVALAVAQALGWQPMALVSDARSPVHATLGRSNFLGAYLAMLLPLTLACTGAGGRRLRAAGVALALAELAVIGLTLARGAWLATGAGLAVLALVWVAPRLRLPAPRWRLAAVALGLLAVAVILSLVIGQRLTESGSGAARLTIWQATAELIARRPLLGYGPDTLGLTFHAVYPPQLVYYQGRGLIVDRAHNLLLDWAVSGGLLAVLAGSWLLFALATAGWRAARRPAGPEHRERRALLAASLAAIGANLAGNLVGFDVTATATLAALCLALAVTLARPLAAAELTARVPAPPEPGPGARRRRGLVAVAIGLAVLLAVWQANVRPLAADAWAHTAGRRADAGDWQGAIDALERAVGLWPAEPAHRLALGSACLQVALAGVDEPLPWLARAEAALLSARDLRPRDPAAWAALGELYGRWGNRWDAARLPLAHAAYARAVDLAPHNAMFHTQWGMVDLDGGRWAAAAARFRRAVDLDATDGYAFTHLGEAELALGHLVEARAAFQQAVHWQPDQADAHLGLATSYWRLGARQEALWALDEALRLAPAHPAARALWEEVSTQP